MLFKRKRTNKYSPLRGFRIQRFPGQTLLFRCFLRLGIMMLIAGGLFGFVITTLSHRFLNWVDPPFWFNVALPWVLMAVFYIPLYYLLKQWIRDLDNFTLGMRGEQAVAAELESLRPLGYRAFHSLNMDKYDIDHVLIGPAGVFAVETKTYSKTKGQNVKITYDGQQIHIPGRPSQSKSLRQAKGNAKAVRELLLKETRLDIWVTPLITYPGWWIDTTTPNRDILVLNPKMIAKTLLSRPPALDPQTINKLVAALEEHQGEVYEGWE